MRLIAKDGRNVGGAIFDFRCRAAARSTWKHMRFSKHCRFRFVVVGAKYVVSVDLSVALCLLFALTSVTRWSSAAPERLIQYNLRLKARIFARSVVSSLMSETRSSKAVLLHVSILTSRLIFRGAIISISAYAPCAAL